MELYEFQKAGKSFLKEKQYALLAHEMGLGKSAMAIAAAEELKLTNVLIICPASVKYTWKNEIAKWAPGASTFIVEGKKGMLSFATYTIINYDLIHSKPVLLKLLSQKYDLIICDEAHYMKNLRAKRTKCVYYPRGLKDRAGRVWLLTGTPILNRPVELYSHLKSLAPDRLGKKKSYIEYCKYFCAAYEGKWGWDVSGASNLDELSSLLDGFMLRRTKEDVLDQLPEKTYQTILLGDNKALTKLSQKERKEYEKTEGGILGELASARRESGLAKVPFVTQHIKDVLEDKQKAVVFAYHRDVISALMAGCREYSPVSLTGATPSRKRQEAVETFKNDPNCRLFIGQIEAAGIGIDGLQDACDTVLFAEMTWVPGQMHQAIDRCHRIGQKNAVLVQFLVVPGSIDEDIVAAIERKEKVIEKVVRPTYGTSIPCVAEEELERIEKVIQPTEEVYGRSPLIEHELPRVKRENEQMKQYLSTTKTEREESDMSMENELKRIADCLERIEKNMGVSLQVEKEEPPVPGVSTKKSKKKKGAEEEPVELTMVAGEDPEKTLTPAGLMSYCNTELTKIKDVPKRTAIIKKVVAMFKEDFGVSSVKETPADKVAEAKAAFDAIVKEG